MLLYHLMFGSVEPTACQMKCYRMERFHVTAHPPRPRESRKDSVGRAIQFSGVENAIFKPI